MKYGERLEQASVPAWSLHNVDYNSLKHQIRAHTSKDQAATAITIPGQQDHGLKRFEDAFYLELCNQHYRVDLFVTSKADEISRRLRHLSGLVQQLTHKCADTRGLSAKRRRRFIKFHTQVEDCGRDIKALGRFSNAQITAFRKILKKYKKWTGSTTLSSRFKENILASPKSFTNRSLDNIQLQYRELRTTLEAASSIDFDNLSTSPNNDTGNQTQPDRTSRTRPPKPMPTAPTTYWNEYEHGSEAGDNDDDYVIYIDPNANDDFPGFSYIKNMLGAPIDQVRHWLKNRPSDHSSATLTAPSSPSETRSLLPRRNRKNSSSTAVASPTDYFSIGVRPSTAATTSNSATEEDLSSEEEQQLYPHPNHHPHHSPYTTASAYHTTAEDYKVSQYRDVVLTRSVIIAFATSFILVGISGLLVFTGRHHYRLEVDAGATAGSAASLFCACMGLGAMLYRQYPNGYLYCLAVGAAFIAACVLNGLLLVVVVGSSGI
ncbi:hypothetical protein F5Y18DRAFT_4929 [Xylariaceae sp. FL1019]|nr:hypothetical protein F5Y18DRAFT_4929 [Xylariaceae sp. FL1019]